MKLLGLLRLSPPFVFIVGTLPAPTSLLGAIKNYWASENLSTEIAPLYVEGAPGNASLPFVVIDGLREILPGPTPDDIPVEMFLSVHHTSAELARTAGRLVEDHLGSAEVIPAAVTRDRLTWSVGEEKFAEREESQATLRPGMYENKRVFRYYIHYRFWISGRW